VLEAKRSISALASVKGGSLLVQLLGVAERLYRLPVDGATAVECGNHVVNVPWAE
jgi:hypothetical protein